MMDHNTQQCPKKMKKVVTVNLGPQFDVVIINKQVPPPPKIPMKTLQAIGTGPCKMAPHELSSRSPYYDSSDE